MYPTSVINETLFKDNYADQIDLDYTNALISNVQFLNTKGGDSNGDGLDVSGSRVIVSSTTFNGFRDKGISVGESSKIFVYDSNLSGNLLGAAVKDRSIAYFTRVDFSNNETDIAAYMKKSIFGGSNVVLDGDLPSFDLISLSADEKSSFNYTNQGFDEILEVPISLNGIKNMFEELKEFNTYYINRVKPISFAEEGG